MQAVTITQVNIQELETLIENSIRKVLSSQQSQQSTEPDQFISIATCSQILNVSRVTIYEYIKEGRLRKYKIGSTTRLLRSQVLSIAEPV